MPAAAGITAELFSESGSCPDLPPLWTGHTLLQKNTADIAGACSINI